MQSRRPAVNTFSEAAQCAVRRWWSALALVVALGPLAGCGTLVTIGTREEPPALEDEELALDAEGNPVQRCGTLKGIMVAVVWGDADLGCGVIGEPISVPFANILGPWVSQALQAVPGVGSAPQPPPQIIIQGGEVVTAPAAGP